MSVPHTSLVNTTWPLSEMGGRYFGSTAVASRLTGVAPRVPGSRPGLLSRPSVTRPRVPLPNSSPPASAALSRPAGTPETTSSEDPATARVLEEAYGPAASDPSTVRDLASTTLCFWLWSQNLARSASFTPPPSPGREPSEDSILTALPSLPLAHLRTLPAEAPVSNPGVRLLSAMSTWNVVRDHLAASETVDWVSLRNELSDPSRVVAGSLSAEELFSLENASGFSRLQTSIAASCERMAAKQARVGGGAYLRRAAAAARTVGQSMFHTPWWPAHVEFHADRLVDVSSSYPGFDLGNVVRTFDPPAPGPAEASESDVSAADLESLRASLVATASSRPWKLTPTQVLTLASPSPAYELWRAAL